jgi:hypothetical protein
VLLAELGDLVTFLVALVAALLEVQAAQRAEPEEQRAQLEALVIFSVD